MDLIIGFLAGLIFGLIISHLIKIQIENRKQIKKQTGNNDRRGCRESLKIRDNYRTPPAIADSLPGPEKLSTEFSTKEKRELVFYSARENPGAVVFCTVYFQHGLDADRLNFYLNASIKSDNPTVYLGEL